MGRSSTASVGEGGMIGCVRGGILDGLKLVIIEIPRMINFLRTGCCKIRGSEKGERDSDLAGGNDEGGCLIRE